LQDKYGQVNGMESDVSSGETGEKAYRPAALQSRSMKTEQSLVSAAEMLFASNGYDGTRIADICDLSDCSSGSFYHRFVDKFGLFKFMFARYQDQVHRVVEEMDITKAGNGDLENLISSFAEIAFETINSNVGFFRAADELTPKHQDIELQMLSLSRVVGEKITRAANEFSPNGNNEELALALRHSSQVIITLIVQTRLAKAPMLPRERIQGGSNGRLERKTSSILSITVLKP